MEVIDVPVVPLRFISTLVNIELTPISKFRSTFAAKGVVTPQIFDFLTDCFSEIIHGYVFWVKESNGDSFFTLYCVTLKLKVIALVHGCGATPRPSPSRSWSGSTAFIHRFANFVNK